MLMCNAPFFKILLKDYKMHAFNACMCVCV